MSTYRKHLSGAAAFRSFVPTPLADITIVHTEALDQLIAEVEAAVQQLNDHAASCADEQIQQLMQDEAESSCRLALGEQPFSFSLTMQPDGTHEEDTVNLLKATHYALDARKDLPLSGRLLKNAHYLMCGSERYAKKYPGEFRNSPTWIGRKGSTLNNALFVPPVYEDMTEAFADLERYINYEEKENVFVRAALIHYQFEMVHPFIDGNGRVGRLLNTLYLMETGATSHPVLQLSRALGSRADIYYKELQRVHDTGDYRQWVVFFLTALRSAALAGAGHSYIPFL